MVALDFVALTPLLILAASSVIVMLLIAFRLSHRIIQVSSLLLFSLAFLALVFVKSITPYTIHPLLVVDGFSVFIMGLTIFSSLVINVLSYIYFQEKEEGPKEYYVLLLLATLGSCVLACSQHFISFFLGLELLSVALYALIAYLRARNHPIEAGIKYLVLAAFSSAFLLFGMALLYMETGKMEFLLIAGQLTSANEISIRILAGLALMLVGIGFKLAVVPFHIWAADVYQGASAPIAAFIATASKAGVLAVLIRFSISIDALSMYTVQLTVMGIAIASMIMGNFLALRQANIKRLLAYSSIAHFGYVLVAFTALNNISTPAVCFYILTYFLNTLTAFGVVTLLSTKESDAEGIENYESLFWRKPMLASILTVSLLSLAGLPLTVGFIGKFYLLVATVKTGLWFGATVLVLTSVVGLFYYLRIISAMFSTVHREKQGESSVHPFFYLLSTITLCSIMVIIIGLGIYPAQVLHLMERLIG